MDPVRFRDEVIPRNEPAILRGAVANWPAVRAGLESPQSMRGYFAAYDNGRPLTILTADASIRGCFFYRDDMQGLNFERRQETLASALDRLLLLLDAEAPPAVYVQSTPIPDCLPRFPTENVLDLLPVAAVPRIWIGNAITVQTHFDLNDNIACVVAGKRRFTLFPPHQLPNLYAGPFDFTLSGPPVSMVSLYEPDLQRYPRFEQALAHALVADLEPGDALYIPYFWWHHVQSLTSFNVLVNYWWNSTRPAAGSPLDCLLHALLTLRDMSPSQRDAWRIVFDHYIFQRNGDPLAHLAVEHRGMLGPMTPERAKQVRAMLANLLSR